MNLRPFVLSMTALLAVACSATHDARTQDASAPAQGDMAMQMPEPGPEHKHLHKLIGKWDTHATGGGMDSKGTAVFEAGPGKFTVFSRYDAPDMMGMPFHGRGIDSWNASKGKYVSAWTDNWSPMMMVLEGSWDAASKSLTMSGEMPDMTGAMSTSTLVTKWIDDDTFDLLMYQGATAEGEPMMTIRHTRK
jgi:hypothetical protein